MQGLVKPAISFLIQSHHELQEKNHPKKYTPKNYYSKVILLLSMYLQISQILDQTPSSVTCPHAIEGT